MSQQCELSQQRWPDHARESSWSLGCSERGCVSEVAFTRFVKGEKLSLLVLLNQTISRMKLKTSSRDDLLIQGRVIHTSRALQTSIDLRSHHRSLQNGLKDDLLLMLTKSCGSSWASCCPSKLFPNAFKFTRIEAHATIANFRTYPWPQLASALLKALVSLPGLESRGRKVWQSRASCNTTLYLVECSKQIRTRYNLHLIRG